MGYYMSQRAGKICIKKENFVAALAAIKALATKPEQMGGGSSTGEKWYSWVTTNDFLKANSLEDALGAWRWSCSISEDTGDLVELNFDGEKLGNDEILLEAIAPFVEPGGYLEMSGEDDALWRWKFDGKKLTEVHGEIVWPD